MKTSKLLDSGIKPVSGLLVDYAPKCTNPGDFKNNDSVVVIKNAPFNEYLNYCAGKSVCLNDPEALKRPTIIASRLERLMHSSVVI